ncbi:MAG TPA: hypothetical protein VNT58_04410 [Gaiellaceae bacterium]|nr:hypothetical protein [Gaiellaceae bacterium]
MRRLLVLASVLAAVLAAAGGASAAPGLVVGVSDDGAKYESGQAAPAIRSVGLGAVRLTLTWRRGQTDVPASERGWLDRGVRALGSDARIVLAVYGASAAEAPQDDAARDEYCAYVRSALARYPQIRDVVIWNEPNKSFFWQPQYAGDGSSAAPAAYGALLARCWDVLHAFRGDVNLITSTSARGNDDPGASSNVSHSPGEFIRLLGAAYRASGRSTPLFDTVGHHPYGEHSSERPWRSHPLSTTIGQGDWDKLTQAYHDAFAGSPQPNPGRCVADRCASIWYMEVGYQTRPDDAKAGLYGGAENTEQPLAAGSAGDPAGAPVSETSPAPDQATQLADAIRLAACQPYVGAYFTFLLRDETDLRAWQSGLFWADWTPKPAAGAVAEAIREVAAGRVDCAALKGLRRAAGGGSAAGSAPPPGAFPAPRTDVSVRHVAWPRARSFNWRNDLWRFRITAGEPATYRATLVRVGVLRGSRMAAIRPRVVRSVTGELKLGYFSWVTFARGRLVPGARYRMEIVLTSKESSARTKRLVGPPLVVLRRPSR